MDWLMDLMIIIQSLLFKINGPVFQFLLVSKGKGIKESY